MKNVESPCPVILASRLCKEQALARAGLLPGKHNHGEEWGLTSLETVQLTQKIAKTCKRFEVARSTAIYLSTVSFTPPTFIFQL